MESQCSSKKSANFSREIFENILLEAINGEKVCFTMITILIHNFFVVGQVFLRIEYVNKEPSAVSILVPHLIHQLKKKEISYDESIFGHLSAIFSGKCRTSVLKTFLSIDSTLTDILKVKMEGRL